MDSERATGLFRRVGGCDVTVSSYCTAGDCVAMTRTADGIELIDTKIDDGPALRFSREEWAAFVAGVKNGEFDVPRSEAAGAIWSRAEGARSGSETPSRTIRMKLRTLAVASAPVALTTGTLTASARWVATPSVLVVILAYAASLTIGLILAIMNHRENMALIQAVLDRSRIDLICDTPERGWTIPQMTDFIGSDRPMPPIRRAMSRGSEGRHCAGRS